MAASPYEVAVRCIEALSPEQQAKLLTELSDRLRNQTSISTQRSILELQGLGKTLWEGLDAQEYVNHERASWGG